MWGQRKGMNTRCLEIGEGPCGRSENGGEYRVRCDTAGWDKGREFVSYGLSKILELLPEVKVADI